MKTNDGYLEYSLGVGIATGVGQTLEGQRLGWQGPVANVDASDAASSTSAVAVEKVINHASGLALGGHARKGGRRTSGSKCILLHLLVRATLVVGWLVGWLFGLGQTCDCWAT